MRHEDVLVRLHHQVPALDLHIREVGVVVQPADRVDRAGDVACRRDAALGAAGQIDRLQLDVETESEPLVVGNLAPFAEFKDAAIRLVRLQVVALVLFPLVPICVLQDQSVGNGSHAVCSVA